MDDERLRQQLHAMRGPLWPDARFADTLLAELEAELGLDAALPTATLTRPVGRARSSWRPWLLVAAALTLLGLVSIWVAGAAIDRRSQEPTRLASVVATGLLRVAVRPDTPQVSVPGRSLSGFDVDVAEELARRLGLRAQLVVTDADRMTTTANVWDVALPGATPLDPGDRFIAGDPYYHWPIFVLVRADAPSRALAALGNATICVVSGSVGEAWAMGRAVGLEQDAVVPGAIQVKSLPSDDACQADVLGGQSDALVTAAVAPADLTTMTGLVATTGGPIAWEPRRPLVVRSGRDAAGFATAIDNALGSATADGTLVRASQQRFGGDDLTLPPTP